MYEPELLSAVEPDVHLVAPLLSLNRVMPKKTRATARNLRPHQPASLPVGLPHRHSRNACRLRQARTLAVRHRPVCEPERNDGLVGRVRGSVRGGPGEH
jgi:hypothetical protein